MGRINRAVRIVGVVGLLAITASCAMTESQFVASRKEEAMRTAMATGRASMECPQAGGTLLSTDVTQPGSYGAGAWEHSMQKAEYTVAIAGCGKTETSVVLCPRDGTGCSVTTRAAMGPEYVGKDY